jgi:zeaxanthin glucosyltransferase
VTQKSRVTPWQDSSAYPEAAELNDTSTRMARKGGARRRLGILSFASPGHYYPLTALGRRLQSRGHQVVYFQVADVERPIRAAGLEFRQIGRDDFPPGSIRQLEEGAAKLSGLQTLRHGVTRFNRILNMLFRDAPTAILDEGVEALVIDQVELGGGTVAEHLGLPFISVSAALPVNTDPSVPPFILPWPYRTGTIARLWNRAGNAAFEWIFADVMRTINRQRWSWGLPAARSFNALFSTLAQVTQLPAALELPGRRLPPYFHHTGPWTDSQAREPIDFPWSCLDPARPLAYASMGTLLNGVLPTFRLIAEACARTELQLVISLGGGQDPSLLKDLPGDPIVVGYAPQLELIRRATLAITHGGLNTVLESLAQGVPMVVLPVGYDQPGVGARVAWAGVGRSIPVGQVTVDRLYQAIAEVLRGPAYRERAVRMRQRIAAADGLNRAADLIEAALGARTVPEPAEAVETP